MNHFNSFTRQPPAYLISDGGLGQRDQRLSLDLRFFWILSPLWLLSVILHAKRFDLLMTDLTRLTYSSVAPGNCLDLLGGMKIGSDIGGENAICNQLVRRLNDPCLTVSLCNSFLGGFLSKVHLSVNGS